MKKLHLLLLLLLLPASPQGRQAIAAVPQAGEAGKKIVVEATQDLEKKIREMFSTPRSPGMIAIGTAEGTMTRDGKETSLYAGHKDPGNGAQNSGVCSWQTYIAPGKTPDEMCIKRMQEEAIPQTLKAAQELGVVLSIEELVIACDAFVQAPLAGQDFVRRLKECREGQGKSPDQYPALCARVSSFWDDAKGGWDAPGLKAYDDMGKVMSIRHDQDRRVWEILETLKSRGIISENQLAMYKRPTEN